MRIRDANSRLSRKRQGIDSEADLQDYLEDGMEKEGWDVIREMSPDHSDNRADIVAKHTKIGWIGIECKYVTEGPIIIPKTVRQVLTRYEGRNYLGNKIDLWGIALFGGENYSDAIADIEFESERRRVRARENNRIAHRVANGFGLGWVTVEQSRVLMKFQVSGRHLHIPLFGVEYDVATYFEEIDTERIRELIDGRKTCD